MREVELAPGYSLYNQHEPSRYVYFPETGTASIVTVLKDGTETEVASVGNEGMIGLPIFSGADTGPRRASWQIAGRAWRMDAARLRTETRRGGALSHALRRFAHAMFTGIAQLATCNRHHTIKQRCCCWLLMTHDRIEGDQFEMTHEVLAQLLGVRRAGITVIFGGLQNEGCIEYRRGRLAILNRRKLEKLACECYGVVRVEFDRLLG
ncbi:MAG: Crp/Fnr family transcriptional regulator [Chthoniobacterales bacterium]|nr:Crp/Fnr family transcriptional regulator [Chthoniobacterales bacterium]